MVERINGSFLRAYHDVDVIDDELTKHSFSNLEKLHKISHQLCKISDDIQNTDDQQRRIISLIGRCHNLSVDREVDRLTEQAQAIYVASKNEAPEQIAERINVLKQEMELFLHNYCLGLENREFIDLAEKFLEKALHHEKCPTPSDDICTYYHNSNTILDLNDVPRPQAANLGIIETANSLFTLAYALHQEDLSKALDILDTLPKNDKFRLEVLAEKVGGSLNKLQGQNLTTTRDNFMCITRAAIGLAQKLVRPSVHNPIPSEDQANEILAEREALDE